MRATISPNLRRGDWLTASWTSRYPHAAMEPRPGPEQEHVSFSLERLVFFSDAVFAIAITLLAIEIRLPEGAGDGDLNAAIADLAPMVFSYFLSFSVIGLSWLAHWRRYDLIERADERLAMINLAQLAFIALIPFPTALLGHYGDQAGPVILYAVIVACAGLLGTLTWIYADRNGMMRPGTTRETVRLATIRGLLLPLVFLSSLPLLLLHPYAVEAAWVLFFPLQALVIRRQRGAHRVAAQAETDEET